MVWNAILPVTIFLLANTLGVSHGAAIIGERGGGAKQMLRDLQNEAAAARGDNINILSPRIDNEFPTLGSTSSVEAPLREWVTSKRSDKVLNEEENENGSSNGDDNDGETNAWNNLNEERFHFKFSDGETEDDDLKNTRVRPLFLTGNRNRQIKPEGEVVMDVPVHGATRGVTRFRYPLADRTGLGMNSGGKMRRASFIGPVVRDQIVVKAPQLRPGKSYYGVPAEGFIRANGYDKRSPRCIAKCMQQGMVHPLQCHSLC